MTNDCAAVERHHHIEQLYRFSGWPAAQRHSSIAATDQRTHHNQHPRFDLSEMSQASPTLLIWPPRL
jgi:hypothetical protein